jgi:hypothetical protein
MPAPWRGSGHGSAIAAAQGHLSIHAQMAAEVDGGEEQVAEFGLDEGLARRIFGGSFRFEFGRLFASFGSRSRQWGQSKPAFCALAPSLAASASAGNARCTESRRDSAPFDGGFRSAACVSAALISSQLRSTRPMNLRRAASTLRLIAGGARGLFAKHMRMAADELVVQVVSTSAMVKWPSLAAISA